MGCSLTKNSTEQLSNMSIQTTKQNVHVHTSDTNITTLHTSTDYDKQQKINKGMEWIFWLILVFIILFLTSLGFIVYRYWKQKTIFLKNTATLGALHKNTETAQGTESDLKSETPKVELQENEIDASVNNITVTSVSTLTAQNEHDDAYEDNNSDEDMYEKKENKENKLLTEWNLEQYAKILIEDKGYEQIDDWKDLTLDDLKRFGFKEGHLKKFRRKIDEYFENQQTKMEGISKDNISTASTPKGKKVDDDEKLYVDEEGATAVI